MTRERRRHRRVQTKNVAGHVRVKDEVLAFGLPIDNISLGGVFVRTTTPLPAGTPVVLELTQPSLKAPLKVVGTTVLSLDAAQASAAGALPGMGIRFDPLPPESSATLSSLLETLTQQGKAAIVGTHNPAAIDENVEASRQAFDFQFVSLDAPDEEPPYFLSPPARPPAVIAPPPPAAPAAQAAAPAAVAAPSAPPSPAPSVVAPPTPAAESPPARPAATRPPPSSAATPTRGQLQPPVRVAVPAQAQQVAAAQPRADLDRPVQVTESARLMVQVRGLLQDLDETRLELERRGDEIERLRHEQARLQADLKKKDERIADLELRLAQR